jgi:hypothetical protein
MSKIIGKYEFEDVTKMFETDYQYGWIHLLPTIEYRHKYWYMWEFNFMFWKWNKKIEITRIDWNQHQEKDEEWFWRKFKKELKNNG